MPLSEGHPQDRTESYTPKAHPTNTHKMDLCFLKLSSLTGEHIKTHINDLCVPNLLGRGKKKKGPKNQTETSYFPEAGMLSKARRGKVDLKITPINAREGHLRPENLLTRLYICFLSPNAGFSLRLLKPRL